MYGGAGFGNLGEVAADEQSFHGRRWSLDLTLPPLSTIFLWAGPDE